MIKITYVEKIGLVEGFEIRGVGGVGLSGFQESRHCKDFIRAAAGTGLVYFCQYRLLFFDSDFRIIQMEFVGAKETEL